MAREPKDPMARYRKATDPWIFAFVFAATFAPQAMERAHPEWMRLVLAVMLVWFIILTIAMAIFVLYEIGTDDDLQ
ncbi:hypothetical protein [Acidithiobacillus ferriphilus]|uniref:hypothetical protein n=1 Tax=Acidithiobacillus ferriphilus TaxID=1689834 RepID=UPI002DB65876|nr:hypothetical protein [Acidithiobacillus ferriphilus]MEB8474563.1 hypothetical protein [Acidithiobacillus ferriphilus]